MSSSGLTPPLAVCGSCGARGSWDSATATMAQHCPFGFLSTAPRGEDVTSTSDFTRKYRARLCHGSVILLGDAWADTTTAHGRLTLTVLGGLAESRCSTDAATFYRTVSAVLCPAQDRRPARKSGRQTRRRIASLKSAKVEETAPTRVRMSAEVISEPASAACPPQRRRCDEHKRPGVWVRSTVPSAAWYDLGPGLGPGVPGKKNGTSLRWAWVNLSSVGQIWRCNFFAATIFSGNRSKNRL